MRVFAPGKLVLTGAYAVLEGAPAIVMATSRGVMADSARSALTPSPEVRVALGDVVAPHVDASSLFVGARKLGLGASAAILVASLGARDLERGADLGDRRIRDALFSKARAAHAEAQGGGSGVDVAASVYGGVLRYTLSSVTPLSLPSDLRVSVFACAASARTADLRGEVDRLAKGNASAYRACMGELVAIAHEAARAAGADDCETFVDAVRRTARWLGRLGAAAGVGIVPSGFDALEELALGEGGAFCVSGAGGGDVAYHLGGQAPSPRFLERAHALGLVPLDLSLDEKGVRTALMPTLYAPVSLGVS